MEKVDENLDKVKGYFDFMGSLSQNIQCMAGDKIKETLGEKKLYFYLVDEVTMQPVIPSGDSPYPIEITTQSEFITTMMPLVKVGFKAIRMVNGLAGIARCLGVCCGVCYVFLIVLCMCVDVILVYDTLMYIVLVCRIPYSLHTL